MITNLPMLNDVECRIGISTYASFDVPGFTAVLKARYSDFIVHEVDLDGNIAYLNQLTDRENRTLEEEEKQKIMATSPTDNNIMVESDSIVTSNDLDPNHVTNFPLHNEKLNEAKIKLGELVGDEAAQGTIDMILSWETFLFPSSGEEQKQNLPEKGFQDEMKNYLLPLMDDKQKRRQIHDLIRSEYFAPYAVADTHERRVRIWCKVFEKQMPNYENYRKLTPSVSTKLGPRKESPWAKGETPDYLKFILYKENIDTTTAVKDIARLVKVQPFHGHSSRTHHHRTGHNNDLSPIGYAGMKDKRGITSQFCTVYRKTPQDFEVINRSQGCNSTGTEENVGGGNSQGGGISVIRVGNFSYVEKAITLGCLRGNRFDVVLRNVSIEDGTTTGTRTTAPNTSVTTTTTPVSNLTTSTTNIRDKVATIKSRLDNATESFKEIGFINYFGMQRFGKSHDTHDIGLAVLKGNFEQACDIIMRVKENDGVQQADVRTRWASRFIGVDMDDDRATREAEVRCAKSILRNLGRFMNAEYSIVDGLSRKPRDYRSAFLGIAKHMRSMYLHSFQSYLWNKAASYRIDNGGSCQALVGDLVLCEQRDEYVDTEDTQTTWDANKVKVLTKEDVDSGAYSIHDVVLPLVGSKVVYPINSTGSYYETLLDENGLSKTTFTQQGDKDTSLRGDYRKLMCKPMNVEHKILVYKDALQPLLQTDLMKLNGVFPKDVIELGLEKRLDEVQIGEDDIFGMLLNFTLPSSSYATVALRELMKQPTDSEYQASLLTDGAPTKRSPEADDVIPNKRTRQTTITVEATLS